MKAIFEKADGTQIIIGEIFQDDDTFQATLIGNQPSFGQEPIQTFQLNTPVRFHLAPFRLLLK